MLEFDNRNVFASMCRLCLSENEDLVSLFSNDHSNTTPSFSKMLEIIEIFTTIKIQPEEDNLPQKICENCIQTIKSMLEFQNKCKQNNEELRRRIMNQDDSKIGIKILNENENEIEGVLDVDKNENSENSDAMADEADECDTKDSILKVLKVEVDDSDSDGKCANNTNSRRHTRSHSKVAKPRRDSTKSSKSKTTSSTKGNKGIKACHICGKLVHNYKFPYHINKHNDLRPFACDFEECTANFAAPYDVQVHKRMVHLKKAEHSCDVCGRAFKRKQALDVHRSYHFDPQIPCKICEKLFKNNRALEKHMLVHSQDRKFKCDTCEKSFQTRYTLRIHKRVHTQEKPYVCHCGVSFAYKCLLKAHNEKHHK